MVRLEKRIDKQITYNNNIHTHRVYDMNIHFAQNIRDTWAQFSIVILFAEANF